MQGEKYSFELPSEATQHAVIRDRASEPRVAVSLAVLDRQMKTRFAIRPLRLGTGELFTISDGEGFTVTCLEGSVWITQSDDRRDIALVAGQDFVLDKPGLALVCAAAGPATLAVESSLPPLPLARYLGDMRKAVRNLPVRGSAKPVEGGRRELGA
jgi:hypothetical protein